MSAIPGIREHFSTWRATELQPSAFVTSVLSGILVYAISIIFAISFAALVFAGPLASQLPQALGFVLVGDAILLGVIALLSSYPGSVGIAQDTPGVVLGVVAASIAAAMPAAVAEQRFATVLMMIVLTTVMTGVLFLALGVFKVGGLARFLPYPVMGGFLAGTGWLLAKGGVGIMVGLPFGLGWLDPQALFHWLPGAILGVTILVVAARVGRSLTLPLLLALGTVLFYIVAAVMNISFSRLNAEGWLVGAIPAGGLSRFPLSTPILSQVNWGVLAGQVPNLVPAAIISVVALLLNASGLELVIKKDIDLGRELIAAGVSNVAAGAVGGLVGYQAISLSTLNYRMAGGKRLVGLVAALLVAGTVFFGAWALMYIPKMILGAVLVYLGSGLLVEWVYQAWSKFPLIDFIIIVAILGAIVFGGFLNGIIFGLVLAVIMFVVSYSRVSIFKYEVSGREYHSRVTRSLHQQQTLSAHGDQLLILKLQGFLFFGTANSIVSEVRQRIRQKTVHAVRFVVLDFAQVTGLDSTGLLSFTRMLQWSQEQGIVLVLTGLEDRPLDQFARGGLLGQQGSLLSFADLDHGIEWCENQIIAAGSAGEPATSDLAMEFGLLVGERPGLQRLLSYMHRREYTAHEYLIRQDEEPDTIYFIESGQVTAQLEAPGRAPVRLETMRGGRAVGELGFYLGIKRTAAVIVDETSLVYSLSTTELENIEKTDPEAANLLHRIVVQLLGERVVHLIRATDALER